MRHLRVATIGGFLTYRALFDWLSPAMFVAAMLATPVFQVIFFATFGPAYSERPPEFFAVGNAVQICAMAGVYGVAQTIANERLFGTMAHLLLSPANRLALYLGRSLPHVVVGLVVSACGLLLAWMVTDFWLPPSRLGALLVVLVVTSASCTAVGLLLGALGLLSRDIHFGAALAYLGLLLVSGAAVPADQLPVVLRVVGEWLPLGNGITATRELVAVGASDDFMTHLLRELLVAAVTLLFGAVVLKRIEDRARLRGDLDFL